MSSGTPAAVPVAQPVAATAPTKHLGMRKNVLGKQWHEPKKAFRPGSGLTSYEKRNKERIARATMKAKEKELKDDKEAARQARIKAIRDRKAAKEEKERYEKLAVKMHRKRVERLKRKEKRNKLLHT
ncbi:rRNA-processing protein CGR1 [Sporothrix schenckii 1099-18]|uniref:rRNA-processing protein n=1 Tax=Sporothrix schenckii 1099-18 TaxID=1397361 RepID=A0A0F2M3Z5_SPOSC|nr:rRNA-processing protein CGR1 [Sporothrix schenckii 1099-18]KJR84407.1 rRNA-processing protein CGR1 [Sporothrix schenckii 1099-18]